MKPLLKSVFRDLRRASDAVIVGFVVLVVMHVTVEPASGPRLFPMLISGVVGVVFALLFAQVWPPEMLREMRSQRSSVQR